MLRQFLGLFSKPTPQAAAARLPEASDLATRALARLQQHGLAPNHLQDPTLEEQMKTARVFFDGAAYKSQTDPSLLRSLTHVAAIDLEGSDTGETQTGDPWPGRQGYLAFKTGDPRGLSPEERAAASKKIISSISSITHYGGYPPENPLIKLKSPFTALILTKPGIQFENPGLPDYQKFIIDPYLRPQEHSELKKALAANAAEALNYSPIKTSFFRYLQRNRQNGVFFTGFSNQDVIILDREKYKAEVAHDLRLILAATEESSVAGKTNYVKLPFAGLGVFAKIEGRYDLKHYLLGPYLRALTEVLSTQHYPHLHTVNVPVFDEGQMERINLLLGADALTLNKVTLQFNANEDVLNFTQIDPEKHQFVVLNPGDANSLPGNEFTYTSVESAIGNNSTMRLIQHHALNPHLLAPENWLKITLQKQGHTLETETSFNQKPHP